MIRQLPSAQWCVEQTKLIKNKDARIRELVWLMNGAESAHNDGDADYYYDAILKETNGWGYELKHC